MRLQSVLAVAAVANTGVRTPEAPGRHLSAGALSFAANAVGLIEVQQILWRVGDALIPARVNGDHWSQEVGAL